MSVRRCHNRPVNKSEDRKSSFESSFLPRSSMGRRFHGRFTICFGERDATRIHCGGNSTLDVVEFEKSLRRAKARRERSFVKNGHPSTYAVSPETGEGGAGGQDLKNLGFRPCCFPPTNRLPSPFSVECRMPLEKCRRKAPFSPHEYARCVTTRNKARVEGPSSSHDRHPKALIWKSLIYLCVPRVSST